MKILIVEDSMCKREQLVEFLEKEKVEFEVCEYVNTALRYIRANKANVAGIILDLGLESMPGAYDANPYRGLDVVREMKRLKLDIPVLINSTTELEMVSAEYPCVFGHRIEMDDYDSLESFVSFLRQREEQ